MVPLPNRLVFSYAGLHSAVERYISLLKSHLQPSSSSTPASSPHPESDSGSKASPSFQIPHTQKLALARAFQKAAVAQLEDKLSLALKQCFAEGIHVKHLVVSGGVASNQFLRDQYVISNLDFNKFHPTSLHEWSTVYFFARPCPFDLSLFHSSRLFFVRWTIYTLRFIFTHFPNLDLRSALKRDSQTTRSQLSFPRYRYAPVRLRHISPARLVSFFWFRSFVFKLHIDNAAMIAWASMHRFLSGDTDDYSMSILPKWSLEELEMGES